MILCGTDLSVASQPALQAAAALARKLGTDVLLVHVRGEHGARGNASNADVELEREAGGMRRALGVNVETAVVAGVPERKLLELAAARAARLIVVAARGEARHARRLGSVPEYLCQKAEVPVLVARNADGWLAFSTGTRKLAVVVGSGLGEASKSALEYVATWPDLSLTVAHVAWPFGEHYRLGVGAPIALDHLHPEIHRQLLSDLGRWTGEAHGVGQAKLDVSPGFGRIDSHLAQIAAEKSADLLVVGTHQQGAAGRLWQGSVSRGAIHEADCSVLCVPQRHHQARASKAPATVVIATDFSPLADRAVAYGYGLLGDGGNVHLVHVLPAPSAAAPRDVRAQLSARIPADAGARGVHTELSVLEGETAWRAIWQYAGRCNADLICMATHSRGAAAQLVLGSQAEALLRHSRIPVLLVPPDREV